MKKGISTVLVLCGAVLELAGMFLFLGNKTGLWPSFPFAGAVTMTVGGSLHLLALSLVQARRPGPILEKKPTSIVVTALALLLFLPLNLGGWLWVGTDLAEGKALGATGVAVTITAFLTTLSYLLIRDAVEWLISRGRT